MNHGRNCRPLNHKNLLALPLFTEQGKPRRQLVVSARENIDAVFDRFDADVSGLSIRGLNDDLMALTFGLFARPGFMKLLDAGQEWSIKREEFKSALQQRVAKTLMIHSPNLSRKSAGDVALVVLLNVKAVATHRAFSAPTSSVSEEFRDMTRLYLQSDSQITHRIPWSPD